MRRESDTVFALKSFRENVAAYVIENRVVKIYCYYRPDVTDQSEEVGDSAAG